MQASLWFPGLLAVGAGGGMAGPTKTHKAGHVGPQYLADRVRFGYRGKHFFCWKTGPHPSGGGVDSAILLSHFFSTISMRAWSDSNRKVSEPLFSRDSLRGGLPRAGCSIGPNRGRPGHAPEGCGGCISFFPLGAVFPQVYSLPPGACPWGGGFVSRLIEGAFLSSGGTRLRGQRNKNFVRASLGGAPIWPTGGVKAVGACLIHFIVRDGPIGGAAGIDQTFSDVYAALKTTISVRGDVLCAGAHMGTDSGATTKGAAFGRPLVRTMFPESNFCFDFFGWHYLGPFSANVIFLEWAFPVAPFGFRGTSRVPAGTIRGVLVLKKTNRKFGNKKARGSVFFCCLGAGSRPRKPINFFFARDRGPMGGGKGRGPSGARLSAT